VRRHAPHVSIIPSRKIIWVMTSGKACAARPAAHAAFGDDGGDERAGVTSKAGLATAVAARQLATVAVHRPAVEAADVAQLVAVAFLDGNVRAVGAVAKSMVDAARRRRTARRLSRAPPAP
jgi:hypothetical protein